MGDYPFNDLDEMNTKFNELGPYVHSQILTESGSDPMNESAGSGKTETHTRFFYANDSMGNLDIYCYYYHEYHLEDSILQGHRYLGGVNSSSNDAYPAIHTDSEGREILYFTSDREGDYDIFIAVPEDHGLVDQAEVLTTTRVQQLSTSADDKCPYISGTTMLFASNRQGGYGGFDLYSSEFSGGKWSDPVNLGPAINTAYDEYRPVLIRMDGIFLLDLMIFSSDRPGGMGRFDLYYAGISR
jgi:hypothetical protein